MPAADGVQPYTKAERLLNLLMALRGTRTGLDRDQIRAVVRGYDPHSAPDAFERMFERDKDELRAMGIPIVTMTDASGVVTGYRVEGDWSLPPLDLDRAELALLGLAARVWQRADLAPAALNALRKVEASLGVESAPQAPAPITGISAESPAVPALIAACTSRTPVTFEYRKGAEEQAGSRHVQPWGVVWWRAHWYLVGHDTDRADLRVFRASRIVGTVRTEGAGPAYTVPDEFDARSAIGRFAGSDRVTLAVALAPGVGADLRRVALGPVTSTPAAGPATTTGTVQGPPGWDVLALGADDIDSGVSAVLAHGAGAVVLGPEPAVADAVRQLDALIAAHEGPAPRSGRAQSISSARTPGAAQFSRLLALVPWLAANSGVSVEVAAAHFGITEEQLRADLGSVITSGADDWTLFDIQYWESGGVIEVIDALELAKPLTLTPDEGFALLVALHALAAIPGPHDRAVLDSLTRKLTAAMGSSAPAPGSVVVRVDLASELVQVVDDALAAGRALELTYLNAVRDEVTERIVDPLGVVVVDGYAYLRAHCRTAQALRLFRLDRILDLRVSTQPARPTPEASAEVEPMAVALAATGRRVVVDLPAESAVLDRHPTTRRWSLPGGGVRAEIPVGDFGWARRLVLGAAGTVILREPTWLVAQVRAEAERARVLLARDVARDIGSE